MSDQLSQLDPFLAELQEECLKDPEGRLGFLREAAGEVVENPNASLKKMIKICSEIEGNFRSVGFAYCAELFSEFSANMKTLSESFIQLGESASADDGFVLQFFLTDVVQTFENYFESLKASGDSEAKANEFRPPIKILSSWRPTASAAVVVAIAPVAVSVATEPSPVANLASISKAIENSSSSNERHQYLICRGPVTPKKSQARVFAIPVQQVLEVIDRQVVSALPFPRAGLEGMLNFRGDPLPVLVCFDRNDNGAKVDESAGKSYLVIANINDRKFGFQMENVLSVTDLDPSHFESPGSWLAPQGATWVTHFIKHGDDVILVMDLNKAVAA